MKIFLSFLLLVCLAGIACKKDEKKPDEPHYDFRDVFVGKYHITGTISCYGPCSTCFTNVDSVISVFYGSSDSTMYVFGRNVQLDADGYFNDYHYGLRLWNDSISSYYANGGLGCGQNEVFLGNKISNTP